MTAIGTRRPREGRCERCDRPLTDETWMLTCQCGCGRAMWCAAPHAPGLCCGPIGCVSPIDWRSRALAAEAQVADLRSKATELQDAFNICDGERLFLRESVTDLEARAIPKAWVDVCITNESRDAGDEETVVGGPAGATWRRTSGYASADGFPRHFPSLAAALAALES